MSKQTKCPLEGYKTSPWHEVLSSGRGYLLVEGHVIIRVESFQIKEVIDPYNWLDTTCGSTVEEALENIAMLLMEVSTARTWTRWCPLAGERLKSRVPTHNRGQVMDLRSLQKR